MHTSLYEARNLAVKECKGEFIAFIDADDYWEKNKLEKQIKLFEKKMWEWFMEICGFITKN